jgi:hypothetical protein
LPVFFCLAKCKTAAHFFLDFDTSCFAQNYSI